MAVLMFLVDFSSSVDDSFFRDLRYRAISMPFLNDFFSSPSPQYGWIPPVLLRCVPLPTSFAIARYCPYTSCQNLPESVTILIFSLLTVWNLFSDPLFVRTHFDASVTDFIDSHVSAQLC